MPVILTGLCAEFNPCFRLLSTKEQSDQGPQRPSSTLASQWKDHSNYTREWIPDTNPRARWDLSGLAGFGQKLRNDVQVRFAFGHVN